MCALERPQCANGKHTKLALNARTDREVDTPWTGWQTNTDTHHLHVFRLWQEVAVTRREPTWTLGENHQ